MPFKQLREEMIEELQSTPLALLFKHSDTCSISAIAHEEVNAIIASHPELPVYWIEVKKQRPLSNYFAEHYNVRHESPQIFLLKEGDLMWHDSHWSVKAAKIEKKLEEVLAEHGNG